MDELIALILSTGTKVVISEEDVLDGFKRPLIVHYVSPDGVVAEMWDYPKNSAMTKSWGAINGVSYKLVSGLDSDLIKVIADRKTGNNLINEYLKDNKQITLTTEQSLQQLQKFSAVKGLLEMGALTAAKELLIVASVDQIFTQERKDKYLSMLTKI